MQKRSILKILVLRTIGNFLILFMLFGFFATFGPSVYYEVSYRAGQIRGVTYVLAGETEQQEAPRDTALGRLTRQYGNQSPTPVQNQGPSLGDIVTNNKQKVLVPPNLDFSIVVPKIGAAEKITANVDPSNKEEYLRVLVDSIAHARGTAYPGVNGTTYLFAHSADNFWDIGRYNAVFYLLKDMQPGDDVILFFKGKRYNYQVYDTKLVDSSSIEYLDAALGQGERIILQTCWPPGTDWKRTLVFAKPKQT